MPERRWDPATLELVYDYGAMGYLYRFEQLVEEVRTPYQVATFLQHRRLGKTVLLDGDIMSSAFDNAYDEAIIALLPATARRVLVLGGGDLSLAAALSRCPWVESVRVVEIDPDMPILYRRHFPERSAFVPGKVDVLIGDAFDLLSDPGEVWRTPDAVVDDMFTVPLGAEGLYYGRIAEAFPRALIVSQTDSLNAGTAERARAAIAERCELVRGAERFVPTYLENWTFTAYRARS